MKFGVVVFPGSNCDHDTYHVISKVIGQPVDFIWHKEEEIDGYDAIILPGGFAYGDYLRTGAIARFSPVMRAICGFAKDGGLVIGICNGFQILCEAGLLPGALVRNSRLSFVSRPVWLRVEQTDTAFTNQYSVGQVLKMPVAHGDGRFVADEATLRMLEAEGRVVVRYVNRDGSAATEEINGSVNQIAGIANAEGNVVGLMPHPDRASDPALGNTDGLGFFSSVVAAVAK